MLPLNDEQRALIEKHHNLIYAYAHNCGLDVCEWYDILAIALCRAAQGYKAERGAFSTYYYHKARSAVSAEYQKRRAQRRSASVVPIDTILDLECEPAEQSDGFGEVDMRDRIERLLDGVPEEDRKIFELLSKGFNQSEIARMLGVTRAAVSRRVDKVRRRNDVRNKYPR